MDDLLSVLIVDDERFILDDLATIVNWERLGFKIVATAFNGRQGLKKYREFHPQLILADIRMPFMDGIEMVREIRKNDQSTRIVLLTAYEDFSYAKAAISLGITEYLVKSEIAEKSLEELLRRIHIAIDQDSQRNRIVADRMLEQFFVADESSEKTKEQKSERNYFYTKPGYVIMVEQDLPIPISAEPILPGIIIPRLRIANAVQNLDFGIWKLEAVTSLPQGQIVVLLNGRTDTILSNPIQELFKCAEKITTSLSEQLKCSVSAYVVNHRISPIELKHYCDAHKSIFDEKYITGAGRIHICDYPCFSEQHGLSDAICHAEYQYDVVEHIVGRDQIEKYLKGVFATFSDQNPALITTVCQNFYRQLRSMFEKIPEKSKFEEISFDCNWREWLDISHIREWLINRFCEASEWIIMKDGTYSGVVSSVIRYIHRHYEKPDLSIQEIAGTVHLSVGYLSSIFRKETGMTIKNYLTELRINKAQELLEKDGMKIGDVSRMVGYRSSQYFSQAFYKSVGILPTEYRRKN